VGFGFEGCWCLWVSGLRAFGVLVGFSWVGSV